MLRRYEAVVNNARLKSSIIIIIEGEDITMRLDEHKELKSNQESTDTHLSFGECLVCKSYFISNIDIGCCIYCGAVTDEEYKAEEYNKAAKNGKADKDYESGERSF